MVNLSSLQLQVYQSSTSSFQSLAAEVIHERSHMFSVNRLSSRLSRFRKATVEVEEVVQIIVTQKKKTWTPQFVCLSDRLASKVPNAMEKYVSVKAGLGCKIRQLLKQLLKRSHQT
jgi:hypothetical protein